MGTSAMHSCIIIMTDGNDDNINFMVCARIVIGNAGVYCRQIT